MDPKLAPHAFYHHRVRRRPARRRGSHCPICAAASACRGFCSTELDLFRSVLGDGVSVERVEHIVSGDRRCAYRVTPAFQLEKKGDL
ncbi:MAG TPA: hypothetical protein VK422_13805 [Pyrinomonadaceae bacterium]|nr:hypothetical protein [Pyrinomonadaceae bacterium]